MSSLKEDITRQGCMCVCVCVCVLVYSTTVIHVHTVGYCDELLTVGCGKSIQQVIHDQCLCGVLWITQPLMNGLSKVIIVATLAQSVSIHTHTIRYIGYCKIINFFVEETNFHQH